MNFAKKILFILPLIVFFTLACVNNLKVKPCELKLAASFLANGLRTSPTQGWGLYSKASAEDIEKEISKTKNELNDISDEIQKIAEQLKDLSGNINLTQKTLASVQASVTSVKEKLNGIEKDLEEKRVELDLKEQTRNQAVRTFYKRGGFTIMQFVFSQDTILTSAQNATYYKKFLDEAKKTILDINGQINEYESDKKEAERAKLSLEQKQRELLALKTTMDNQVKSAQTVLTEKEGEKADLQKKLEDLSAKQRALLSEKTDTFATSVGDVPLSDDSASSANYNPGFSPAFAVFSFGAPHRKGMSQYGAYGRAMEGQGYEEILKAYYGDVEIETRDDLPEEISTSVGTLDFEEDYLMGIAEMPSSWDENDLAALKAQAIAARSYALVHGKPICIDEGCQVYSQSKSNNTPANWVRAVEETRGMVVVSKKTGNIINAWYASTSGGYNYSYSSVGHTTQGGWDTKCSAESCWSGDAYEKISGSPWFYKAWYKTRGGASCGRRHPWLDENEFSDIVNALIVFTHDADLQEHLSQVDANSCWDKGIEGIWDEDEVKDKASEYGGGVSSISSVDVEYSSQGYTEKVTVQTDKGSFAFDGDDFKYVFNLRAPGAIHLKSALFNVEKK